MGKMQTVIYFFVLTAMSLLNISLMNFSFLYHKQNHEKD